MSNWVYVCTNLMKKDINSESDLKIPANVTFHICICKKDWGKVFHQVAYWMNIELSSCPQANEIKLYCDIQLLYFAYLIIEDNDTQRYEVYRYHL